MGSGKVIIEAIKKYGLDNFEKEIIKIFDNPADMFKMEAEIVDDDFVSRKDTYNIGIGGEGGPHFKGKKHTDESKAKFSPKGRKHKKSKEALDAFSITQVIKSTF